MVNDIINKMKKIYTDKKKITGIFLLILMLSLPVFLSSCKHEQTEDIIILYTNDVASEVHGNVSFGEIKAYKDELMAENRFVSLVDAGDYFDGKISANSEGKYIASFCGFGPVENPRIALLVMIDEPSGNFYGGQIAAPVASRILAQVFRYMKIEPSSAPGIDEDELPEDVGEGDTSGNSALSQPAPPKAEDSPAPAEEEIPAPAEEIPQINSNEVTVPDFYNKSIRDASRLASDAGLKLEMSGSGFAVEQSIDAGAVVERGTVITVKFSPSP